MNVKFLLICIVSCIFIGCAVAAEKEFRVIHDVDDLERTLKKIESIQRSTVYQMYSSHKDSFFIILGESPETGEPIEIPYNYEFHEKFKEVMGIPTDKQVSEGENLISELKRKSSVTCIDDVQCKKLFQLTQLFINETQLGKYS